MTGPIKVVEKLWGTEDWLINEPEYCAKRLLLYPGFQCSLHRHHIKKETFIVEKGIVLLEVGNERLVLGPDDSVTILPEVWHRFASAAGATILEVSTHHSDDDVERIEESRKFLA